MSRFVSVAGEQVADLIERVAEAGRLSRGRALFRKGCVSEFVVEEGSVLASVRGSGGDDYETSVGTAVAPPGVVRQIVQAQDLAGYEGIDELMADGVDVCPRDMDLAFACDCADWDEPCKHVIALLLALADRVDLDVTELLRWRGVDLAALKERPDAPASSPSPTSSVPAAPAQASPPHAAPSPPGPTSPSLPASSPGSNSAPADAAKERGQVVEPEDRSTRLAELEALLGNTALRVPPRGADESEQVVRPIDPALAEFLGVGASVEPLDLSDIVAAAPLFNDVPFGPLADLGPEFAKALAIISEKLNTV